MRSRRSRERRPGLVAIWRRRRRGAAAAPKVDQMVVFESGRARDQERVDARRRA